MEVEFERCYTLQEMQREERLFCNENSNMTKVDFASVRGSVVGEGICYRKK